MKSEKTTQNREPFLRRKGVKPLLYFIMFVPLWLSIWQIFFGHLGANPVEKLLHRSGFWALNFLIVVLVLGLLGPHLKKVAGKSLKKETGLVSLAYAFIHFLIFIVAEHFFDFEAILKDIAKRPYITMGFSAFLILAVLGVTSLKSLKRRLGATWKKIHRFVYLAGALAAVHFLWQSKIYEPLPWGYVAVFCALVISRAVYEVRRRAG